MAELKIRIPEEVIKLKVLRKKVESEEEKELTKWAVELGRKAKKSAFKRLVSELSPEKKKKWGV